MKFSLKAFDSLTNESEFSRHALALFEYQFEHNAVYRSYCDLINTNPSEVQNITEIPFLPIQFFKSHKVFSTGISSKKYFESSGTTGQIRSKHYFSDLSLYHKSFEKGFEIFYGPIKDYALLALLPSYLEREHSSLVYMANELIQKTEHPSSGFYLDEWDQLKHTLKDLENKNQKTILLGVSFALLEAVENYDWNLKNTLVMETGGMKGMRKEWIRSALHNRLKEGFGVESIHAEYGMTELLSQAYSKADGIFYCPPWMHVSTRAPEDPFEIQSLGKTGGLNIIDLANIDSCAFIATQDLGIIHSDGGFEVLGRFDQAEVRGCNLMVI
ncbi:acyl transferase [Flavobacteriaceae bacterium]|nr:acyl transferase [Flavobacteriaceae bacterium]